MMEKNTLSKKLQQYLASASDRPFLYEAGVEEASSLSQIQVRQKKLTDMLVNTLSGLDRKAIIGIAINANVSWVVANFASILAGAATLPVPTEFSDTQLEGLLHKADVCLVDCSEMTERITRIFPDKPILSVTDLYWDAPYRENRDPVYIDDNIVSIIHTSGTTSNPKGVLIRDEGIAVLIDSLFDALGYIGNIHYFSIVPFSLLIEQVLAVYLPLFSGGSLILKPQHLPDFSSQSGLAKKYLLNIRKSQANCVFLPPKLVEELGAMAESDTFSVIELFGETIPHLLTGGAKVSTKFLHILDKKGVRIYEGYGLSENSSVVSLNTPGEQKIGSAGRPLPHVRTKFVDNELYISGDSLCAGYLGTDSSACVLDEEGFLATGDIGCLDSEGYLQISGRKKNIIILSNTRNICPEWVEQIYKSGGSIDDIVVYGDGRETLSAIVFMDDHTLDKTAIKDVLTQQNHHLPSFSQVKDFIVLVGQEWRDKFFTVTGRPKRQLIETYMASSAI
jgi:long-subunit acyl-CoA synthetase (AMP-forming)